MTMIHRLSLAAAGPAAVGAALLLAAGCSKPMPAAPAAGAASSETAASSAESRFEIASPDRETWDVFRIQGIRIGYGRTAFGRATQDGRELVKVAGDIHLAVEREGQSAQQAIRFTSTETLQGALVGFESELQMGPSPMRTIGRVRGDRLELEVTSAGKTVTSSMAWSPQYGGPTAPELSLLRQPMKPGEKRTIRSLDISVNHVVETDMTARGVERVELLAGAFDLLRIDTVIHMPGNQTLRGAVWTDRSGETLKSRVDLLNMEVVRATKEAALAKTKSAKFDLWEKSIVKVDRPMERAHDTKRVRYRVHLDEGDPAATFASGPTQSVKRIDEHAAEVTVLAIRPGQTGNPDAADSPPTDADRKSTNFIQSDDERIVADAREAAGAQTDPWRVATALERYVHKAVTSKSFTQAFATAAEVARSREGDCTEHAVYLAALARARGIPARVAVGLVYVPRDQAFGYHMWTEMYVDKRWIPLDGTLAKGGIGAAHLKVAHSSMDGLAAYSSFLPVAQIIGHLKIDILEAE